jgi:putative hemolysin
MSEGAPEVLCRGLRGRSLAAGESLADAAAGADLLFVAAEGIAERYRVAFAASARAVEAAQRLRFQIFNVELNEGLEQSYATGLDRDEFDGQMTHLLLLERASGEVIGTYRLQTGERAAAGRGFYSAQEFDLSGLGEYLARSVECGRACIAEGHRNFAALHTLWAGIGAFMNMHGSRWLFGCCSLTTTDPDDGWRAMKTIRARQYLHPRILLRAQPDRRCGSAERERAPDLGDGLKLPKLFQTYMRLGAKVISEPAVDPAFGTVDFLVFMDSQDVTLSSLDLVR